MLKILEILTDPNPELRKTSKPVTPKEINTEEFQKFLDDLNHTMLKKDGVGLAAPQTGKKIRVFVINSGGEPIFFINPVINKKSWIKIWGEEGCLSVPKIFGDVRRHKKLVCSYLDRKGEKRKIEADDLLARVIQHENDHLDGTLFIDKAKNIHHHK
jgi:peptide deformylase